MINYSVINNTDIVTEYIDDYLYKRLKFDDRPDSYFLDGGVHLGFYNNDRLIGIVTFGVFDLYATIHPKFRRRHMIYAKKCCLMAIEYIEKERSVIMAKIPSIYKENKRMALACGFKLLDAVQEPVLINGNVVSVNAYARGL